MINLIFTLVKIALALAMIFGVTIPVDCLALVAGLVLRNFEWATFPVTRAVVEWCFS